MSTVAPPEPSRAEVPSPGPTPPRPERELSVRELWRKTYAFFHNKKVGLMLILAMAFLALMGALIQQAPEGVRGDEAAYAEWLETARPRYGGWTDILSALGFFEIFSSVWFVATTLLLVLSIIACTTHRMPQLWQRATRPHLHVGRGFFTHATIGADMTLPVDRDEAKEAVAAQFRRRRYRLIDDPRDEGSFYTDKNRWAPFGTALAHTAFVVILAGFVITGQFGFRDASFAVPVGETRPVGHGTDLAVQVNSFRDAYYDDGRPSDYVSDVILLENGQPVEQQEVRVNTPLNHGGISINQSYFGVAAQVTVADASGRQLFAGGVPLQFETNDEANVFGRLDLPETGYTLFVIGAASGRTDTPIAPGQMQVDIYEPESDIRSGSVMLDQGTPGQVGDFTVTFERERQFTGLQVSRDPGAVWVYTGSALLVIGTWLTMGLKHRRVWVRVSPAQTEDGQVASRVQLAGADRRDIVFARQMNELVSAVRTPYTTTPAEAAGVAGRPTE